MFYHVRITKKSSGTHDALELDLSKEELLKMIVNPFLNNERFMCGGEPIDSSDVEQIKINETEQLSSMLLPYIKKEKAIKRDPIWWIPDEWYITEKGKDVTREFLISAPKEKSKKRHKGYSNRVFIVHGRDEVSKYELARILERDFRLEAVILHEQPSGGSMTIVEKLERYSDVGYAFVILTPDDVGCLETEIHDFISALTVPLLHRPVMVTYPEIAKVVKSLKPRARQNVVLEFGYFMGLLGRAKVCCLYKGNVALPSDMHGIVYVPFKESISECYRDIQKNLRDAGYKV